MRKKLTDCVENSCKYEEKKLLGNDRYSSDYNRNSEDERACTVQYTGYFMGKGTTVQHVKCTRNS